jgi:hypothetical protein
MSIQAYYYITNYITYVILQKHIYIFAHLHYIFSLASLFDKVTTVPKAGILKIINKLHYYKRVI